jgi:hypothetical protein
MKTPSWHTRVRTASAQPLKCERLQSHICRFPFPFFPEHGEVWKPNYITNGYSAEMNRLSCHVSALEHGAYPHPPHKHGHEEILFLLGGEAELLLPENKEAERVRLREGNLVYYPARFAHSLQCVSVEPATYLMFKWIARCSNTSPELQYGLHDVFGSKNRVEKNDGFQYSLIFEGSTRYLKKIHCHSSVLAPGGGYDAHKDNYAVAIILLEGELITLDQRVGPYTVIFYKAGDLHGMINPGATAAKYVVFEFHIRLRTAVATLKEYLGKAREIERWKRKFRQCFD